MRRCPECHRYTMLPACHGGTGLAHPPKFSFQDRFARYRRGE